MNVKVLYAEDEFTNRKLIEIQLKRYGVQCDLAENGQEALELYRRHSYKLIMVDNYMPKLSGKELVRIIRQENSSVPIIAITSDDEEVSQLLRAGCNEVLIKPLHGPAYLQRILRYLEKEEN